MSPTPKAPQPLWQGPVDVVSLAASLVPAPTVHKYTRGRLVLVAGSAAYPGAAILAARAAQRVGSGYVQLFTADSVVPAVQMACPSVVVCPASSWDAVATCAFDEDHPGACALGSGFDPHDAECVRLALHAVENVDAPLLIDAGGIGCLASAVGLEALRKRAAAGRITVITPHGGEAATLEKVARDCGEADDSSDLNQFDGAAQQAASARAMRLARALSCHVVLKGPDTFVADGVQVFAMEEGTAALAKAGTGDVLTGVIGGLLAQGAAIAQACYLGATLHARAGLAAQGKLGIVSVTAEDVVDHLAFVIKDLTG